MADSAAVISFLPLWATLVPIAGSLLTLFLERYSWRMRNWLSILTSFFTWLLVIAMYPQIYHGKTLYVEFPMILPPLGLSFSVDYVGFFFAVLISFVWLMVTIYTTGYMAKEHHKKRYYPFMLATLGGSIGVPLSGDLLTLFIFFELMSLTSYVLVIHEETVEAMKAGFKYLIMTIIGSLGLFFAIIATYQITGTLHFAHGGLIKEPSSLAFFAFLGYLLGFGMKAGMFPLHVWLPDAHPVAPSPASALLSGLMIKTGAYGLIRVYFDVYGSDLIARTQWTWILVWISCITILLGSAVAIVQEDFKRRLAYSSVSQIGYILLGISLLNESALTGAIYHIFGHALMKSTLFLVAGSIIHETGIRNVRDLAGIGIKMPFTMSAFTMAAISMIGVPPLVGFVSKWSIGLGAFDAGAPLLVVVLLLSSLMNAVYYLPISISAFFGETDNQRPSENAHEPVLSMLIPVLVLAFGILIFNVLPTNIPLYLARISAQALFGK